MIVFFAVLSPLLYLIGFIPYIYQSFRGRVVPHAFTWTVAGILSTLNTITLYHNSTEIDIFLLSPIVRSSALIIGACVGWYFIHKITITKLDYIAIILAIGCLAIAAYFGGTHAIIPSIIVDILILTPTIKKIWIDPYSEGLSAWVLVIFSQASLLLAMPNHAFETTLFWYYVMLMNACMSAYIIARRSHIKEPLPSSNFRHIKKISH